MRVTECSRTKIDFRALWCRVTTRLARPAPVHRDSTGVYIDLILHRTSPNSPPTDGSVLLYHQGYMMLSVYKLGINNSPRFAPGDHVLMTSLRDAIRGVYHQPVRLAPTSSQNNDTVCLSQLGYALCSLSTMNTFFPHWLCFWGAKRIQQVLQSS